MNKELVELILNYIDAKINDEIFNHKTAEHGGCYYAYSNDATKIKIEIEKLLEDENEEL